jgi:YD repeat-containing protein
LTFAILPAALFGQPATGLPPFGSFSGGPFDVVNNANLNVHFQIPIVNKAGRGLPFSYALTYDSSVWYPSGAWVPVSNWGWKAVTAVALTGYVSYQANPEQCNYQGTWYYWTVYAGWIYHDPYGVSHYFPGIVWSSQPPTACGGGQFGYSLNNVVAADGSGYIMSFNAYPSYSGLAAPNGVQINAPLQSQTAAGSLTDRNGNIISISSGSTPTFTDTLGDTALTVSGAGTPSSPTVLSYTNPSGGSSSYKVNYTAQTVQTAFGCSGTTEYGASLQNLISSITLPDGTSYAFQYETTPNHSPNVTGRLYTVTLPTGGIIKYTYSGSNGITCADGTAATLNRTTPDSSTAWVYLHSETSSQCASGSSWCTTVTDPSTNQTVLSFQPAAPAGGQTNGYEVQRKMNQGSSTLLETVDTCYNGQAPPCPAVAITAIPPSKIITRTTPGGYTLQAYRTTTYNSYGLPLNVLEYDYGNGAQGSLLRQTTTAYASLGNNIVDMPSSVSVYNGASALIAQTKYTYDQGSVTTTSGTPQHTSVSGSRGNATTIQYLTAGSTYLSQTYTYYDTGNVNVFTGVNSGQTTYAYGSGTSCGNSFPTGITEAVTALTRSYAWNCTGAVMTSATDENSQIWSAAYTDPNYWRPTSATDPASASTSLHYYTGPFATESTLNFNGTTSTADTRAILDGLGRTHVSQRRQTQGGTNYDSVETDYDAEGRPNQVTVPYTGTAGQTNGGATRTTTTYDALGRPLTVTDGGGGATTYTYTQTPGSSPVGFDVLVTAGGGQSFKRQFEYDGLGRLTSVCEITSASGSGSCAQSVAPAGYWTKYTYNVLNDLLTVTQNAQGTGHPPDPHLRL